MMAAIFRIFMRINLSNFCWKC